MEHMAAQGRKKRLQAAYFCGAAVFAAAMGALVRGLDGGAPLMPFAAGTLCAGLLLAAALVFLGQYTARPPKREVGRALPCLSLGALLCALWLILPGAPLTSAPWCEMAALLLLPAPLMLFAHAEYCARRLKPPRALLAAGVVLWGLEVALFFARGTERAAFPLAYLAVLCLLDARVMRELRALLNREPMRAEHYKKLAYHDVLTGCGSRMAYELDIKRMKEEGARGMCLALFDLNDLKRINDQYGHAAGDDALTRCARCIGEVFGGCYRIGGDEFAYIMPSLEERAAQTLCEKFARIVRENDRQTAYPFAVSVGCAQSGAEQPLDLPALYEQADQMLYADKRRQKLAI